MPAVDRLLNLAAALLDTSSPLSIDEIRRNVPGYSSCASDDAFRRMFERDKEGLIDIGVVITFHDTSEVQTGYSATRAQELTSLQLTPGELASLELAAASVRLNDSSESDVLQAVQQLGGGVADAAEHVAALDIPDNLADLFEAIRKHRVVSFTYSSSPREVQPHRLEFRRGRWYLSGFDLSRDADRSFRVDRIASKVKASTDGVFEPPEDRRRVNLEPWAMGSGDPLVATVALDPEIAALFFNEYPNVEEPLPNEAGSVLVDLPVVNVTGLFIMLLSYLDRVELVGPAEIRDKFCQLLLSLAEVK